MTYKQIDSLAEEQVILRNVAPTPASTFYLYNPYSRPASGFMIHHG
jgi:hypothetical protein